MYDGSTWTYFSSDGDVITENVPESTDTCSFGNFEKALPAFENRAWVCVDGYWGIIEI